MSSPRKTRGESQFSWRPFVIAALAICLMMVTAGALNAQTIFGRISGTIRDNQGGVVPNANVTITDAATNLVRNATTDEDGFYTATNLPVGTYTILVVRDGFKRAQQDGVVLAADARVTSDLTLEVGQLTETVQVASGVGETVNTTSGEVARVVDQRQVQNLALNGR